MLRFSLLAALVLCALPGVIQADEASELFKSKVQPLLKSKCFECHSAKAEEVKGGLKLDTLEDILKGGPNGPSVVPGETTNSFLLRAIRYEAEDFQMPPSGKLSDEEIELVEKWVRKLSADAGK